MLLAVAIPKTNSVPSRLRRRSAGRGGTLRDANGGATPAQANRRGTVQKVDVTIGSWTSKEEEESNEKSKGSYVLYKGGIPTVADMSFLTPVTFSCAPDNLPPNAPIRITHSGRGTLYMKVAGSDVLTPATPYPAYVSDLEGKEFYLHGSTVSGDVSDSSIRIEHLESGATDEAGYAVVSFSFDIESEKGAHEANVNQLTDNRPGIITIQQRPTSFDLSHANIAFSSVPGATLTIREADGESIINKKGTNISFAPLNPTQWKTSPIYWYGVTPEHECHYYAFDYIFTMFLGGIPVASKQYVVIYPSERPRMTWKTPTDNLSHVTNPVFVQYRDDNGTMQNLWRCEIVFGEYIKEDPSLEGLPVTDQYALETEKEELFHMKQFKGEVPPSEGGLGQCYTKQGIIFYAQRAMGAAFGTPCYIYGATSDDAYERATAILDEAIAFEKAESFRVIAGDFYYREAKAKEYANYNAAWRYHCTFSSEFPTPIHCIHEAYLTP